MSPKNINVFMDEKRPVESKKVIELLKKAGYRVSLTPGINLSAPGPRAIFGRTTLQGEKEVIEFLEKKRKSIDEAMRKEI